MKSTRLHLLILICALPFLFGCTKYPENPNRPLLPYPITIYPNQMQYQNLHTIGGWEYITSEIESTSRGIIVFRRPDADNLDDTFAAYDRMPPNEPDACTDSEGNTTRMIVDYPFVVDRCNNAYYNILNGQIIIIGILNMKCLDMRVIGYIYIGKKSMGQKPLEQFGKNQDFQMMLFKLI